MGIFILAKINLLSTVHKCIWLSFTELFRRGPCLSPPPNTISSNRPPAIVQTPNPMLYYVVSLLSQIYCDGPILQAVQDARLFPDSKYFVDMPLKLDPGFALIFEKKMC
jgi:hypothetical protein